MDARQEIRSMLGIERLPDGMPGVRDVDARCNDFEPGPRALTADCETDGHYLCAECAWRAPVRTWFGNEEEP